MFALQVIGVAVLGLIVFMAFLRPLEPGDLFGIDAGGAKEPSLVVDPPPIENKKGRGGDMDESAPQQAQSDDGLGVEVDEDMSTDNGGDITGPPLSGEGDTPSVDQYDDIVMRLMNQVGRPALFRELGPNP